MGLEYCHDWKGKRVLKCSQRELVDFIEGEMYEDGDPGVTPVEDNGM